MSDLVQIARSRIDGAQRTHWEGCERDHRECLIQRMADEIERLIALRRDDARVLERMRAQIADRPLVDALRALPDTRPEPEPFEVWREICGLALSSADEIDRLRAQIADAEVIATYDRDDGLRDWVDAGAWLYPGERVVVLRREE